MKNTLNRKGYLNRHTIGLPDHKCIIEILLQQAEGEYKLTCEWTPFDKSRYTADNMPDDGYLGTTKVIQGKNVGFGYHAWEPTNDEFVWYKKLEADATTLSGGENKPLL